MIIGSGELGDIGRKVIAVKGREIARRPSASDYHHTVPFIFPRRYRLKRAYDTRHRRSPLHEGGKQFHIESQTRRGGEKLVDKVAVAGGSRSGNHRYPQRRVRPLELTVEVNDSLALESGHNLHAPAKKIAHGI